MWFRFGMLPFNVGTLWRHWSPGILRRKNMKKTPLARYPWQGRPCSYNLETSLEEFIDLNMSLTKLKQKKTIIWRCFQTVLNSFGEWPLERYKCGCSKHVHVSPPNQMRSPSNEVVFVVSTIFFFDLPKKPKQTCKTCTRKAF